MSGAVDRLNGRLSHKDRARSIKNTLISRFDRVDNVIGSELDAVAPIDAFAKLHRHFREVGVVLRLVRSERVVPYAVQAGVGVNVPERVHAELL